jgi:hypothetical protein
MSSPEAHDEEGWGWGAFGEDDASEHQVQESVVPGAEKSLIVKSASDRSLQNRKHSGVGLSGITSSPSFQELEKAIGATLALNLSNNEESNEQKNLSPSSSFLTSKLSSTNLTQQKVLQQRMRQFQANQRNPNLYFRHSPGVIVASSVSAKSELSNFVNEPESRALVVFHSPSISPNSIKEACSKYGILYYIRPEFHHHKGVTFLSYFDLQAAMMCKENLPSVFPVEAEISVCYSIMLHATASNTEEFRLLVKNPSSGEPEAEVQSIFSRYGQLRSIQKTFGSAADLGSSQSLPAVYSIEYFNIQDARLAASELSATSAAILGSDASVSFAPLDERKQSLCRQLLATLSRWRSEIALSAQGVISPVPASPTNLHPFLPGVMHVVPNAGLPFGQMSAGLFPLGNHGVDVNGYVPMMPGVQPFFPPNTYPQPPRANLVPSGYFPFPQSFPQPKLDASFPPYQIPFHEGISHVPTGGVRVESSGISKTIESEL